MGEIYSKKNSRAILGISRTTLWRMEKRGELKPTLFVNGQAKYSIEDLAKAVKTHAEQKGIHNPNN